MLVAHGLQFFRFWKFLKKCYNSGLQRARFTREHLVANPTSTARVDRHTGNHITTNENTKTSIVTDRPDLVISAILLEKTANNILSLKIELSENNTLKLCLCIFTFTFRGKSLF